MGAWRWVPFRACLPEHSFRLWPYGLVVVVFVADVGKQGHLGRDQPLCSCRYFLRIDDPDLRIIVINVFLAKGGIPGKQLERRAACKPRVDIRGAAVAECSGGIGAHGTVTDPRFTLRI